MARAKPTLVELRRKLKKFERNLLDETWQQFMDGGEWPMFRTLYRTHGKNKTRAALIRLGGSVGREESSGGRWKRYCLTLLGALLTSEGPSLEDLMIRLFEFQRWLFQTRPDAPNAKSEEIGEVLKLGANETALLGKLVRLSNISAGYSSQNNSWSVDAMEQAEDFPETGELASEFESWLLRFYDPDAVVFEEQRHTHYARAPVTSISEFAVDAMHPAEITQSLHRLRKLYPDGAKLGFLIMRFTGHEPFDRIVKVIKETVKLHGLEVIRADETQFHTDLWGNVRTILHGCGFGIAIYERIDQEEPNANVGLEVGYLMAMNKPVLLLKDKTVRALQSDLAGKLYVPFDPHDPESSIPERLTKWLKDHGVIVSKA